MLKAGDVLICRRETFLSKAIRWATDSDFNHVAVFIEIWGQPWIVEAQMKGVHIMPFNEWIDKYGYRYLVYRNPEVSDYRTLSIRAMSKVGVAGYDFTSLFLRQPWLLVTGNWYKTKNESDRMYCSEYALWIHHVERAYRMSPQNVYEYVTTNNWIPIS